MTIEIRWRLLFDKRMELGLTQEEVAERTKKIDPMRRGVSVPTISNAERGEPIRNRSAALIGKALGLRVDQVLVERKKEPA